VLFCKKTFYQKKFNCLPGLPFFTVGKVEDFVSLCGPSDPNSPVVMGKVLVFFDWLLIELSFFIVGNIKKFE